MDEYQAGLNSRVCCTALQQFYSTDARPIAVHDSQLCIRRPDTLTLARARFLVKRRLSEAEGKLASFGVKTTEGKTGPPASDFVNAALPFRQSIGCGD